MSILFSRQCEYALQAVMYIASKSDHHTISIKDLTKTLDIPFHFLAKILQDLVRKGLLVSQKGPTGGFSLAQPANEITLLHIIEAIDGDGFQHGCVLGFERCSAENPCALHDQWSSSRDKIMEMLSSKSVAEMAGLMKKPQFV